MIRTVTILCIGIVALDAVESVISRAAGIPYVWFMIVQIFVYAGIGFVLRRRGVSVRPAMLAVCATAFVEATLGEFVAVALAATPATPLAMYVFVIPFVIVIECGLALAGFAIASIGRTARS